MRLLDFSASRPLLGALVALLLGNLAGCGLLLFAPSASFTVAPSQIQPESGKAYQAALGSQRGLLYDSPTDGVATPYASRLMLFEDGRPLGPRHSAHTQIRDKGKGRFSHWGSTLVFAASDGTDPRINGRTYSVTIPSELKPRVRSMLIGILTLADVALAVLFRDQLTSLARKRAKLILAGTLGATVLVTALFAFGPPGAVVIARDGPPKDVALVLLVVGHALLGCVTSCCVWAAGAGLTRLVLRDASKSLAQVLIPAFPISLVLLAFLMAIALLVPFGRALAFALWIACLLPLLSWRPRYPQVAALLKAVLGFAPLGMAFGIWMGLLWHGPTDTLTAAPTGDLTFYAGEMWSLAARAYPHFDLGYEGAAPLSYFNILYPAFGAVLLGLPRFDPFLFLLASGGTSYILLSGIMVHLYMADRFAHSGTVRTSFADLLLLALAFIAAARYPYWVAESIPMVFVPALVVSVWWMAERGQRAFGWTMAAMLAALSGSFLTKVTSAAMLVPLGSAGLWRQIRALPFAARMLAFMVIAAFGAYSVTMLAQYLPLFLANSVIGPESYRTPHWYFYWRDAAALLMMALAWTIVDWPVASSLSLGMVTYLCFSWVFQVNFVCIVIVLGLILVSLRPALRWPRLLAWTAFGLSLPALILGNQLSSSSGFVWIICVGGTILIASLDALNLAEDEPRITLRTSASVVAATLAVTVLGLIGVARGSIIADSGWHTTENEPLSPALKKIWSVVRERTPKDALIFTDQVDETEHVLGGWNTYAYFGQRQVYLSSYYTNFDLREHKPKLAEVLAMNSAVLDGQVAPQSVATRRVYSSFYAVIARAKAAPPDWQLIFENQKYALYRIGSH